MGQPKQLLPWRGRTLLRHACETALLTNCHPVIVVLGCQAERCQAEIANLPVSTIVNDRWHQGMGTSVACGIAELEQKADNAPASLLMLVDQPDVTPELLRSLIFSWKTNPEKIVATAYDQDGGVPALFPRGYFRDLQSLAADRGARSLIAREADLTLVCPAQAIGDLDTPEEYRLSTTPS